MDHYHLKLTKRLGQHLLVDPHYLDKVADHDELQTADLVLEVGPGTGNLTERLIGRVKKLLAVELDERFCQVLENRFGEKIELFQGDILKSGKLNPEVVERLKGKRWALASNLPYNVASPLLIEAFYCRTPENDYQRPTFFCVTIQREVAQRMTAKPDSRQYGVLSVLLQAMGQLKILSVVPPGAFLPPPKVHSAIVTMSYDPERAGAIQSPALLRETVSRLFRHRRKTLRGGWVRQLPEKQQSIASEILQDLKIDPTCRPENLSVETFVALSNALVNNSDFND